MCWLCRVRLGGKCNKQEYALPRVKEVLDSVCSLWVNRIVAIDDRDKAEVSRKHWQVFPFGSAHLGVCFPGSDIDILLGK